MNLDRRRSDLHFVQRPAGGHVFFALLAVVVVVDVVVVVVVDVVSSGLWRQMLSTARVEKNIFGPIVAKLSRQNRLRASLDLQMTLAPLFTSLSATAFPTSYPWSS